MIKPLNSHVLIEPIEQGGVVVSGTQLYEEMGVVVDIDADYSYIIGNLSKGDKVFFDSWTAAKYPTGEEDKYYWLVPYESIRAVEKHEPLPKQPV